MMIFCQKSQREGWPDEGLKKQDGVTFSAGSFASVNHLLN
jgi:hypothetical protein